MRRVIFYLFYDPEGKVDEFVLYKLRALRPHAERICVMSNSHLDEVNQARLAEVADDVWERENVGFDVGGYHDALSRLGKDELATYDELIMMNCTFFGPVGSFGPVFARTEADPDVDFWGISDHGATEPHPFVLADRMEAHVQSHWIAVRSTMFGSEAWNAYWRDMPPITSYVDSVVLHEGRFTSHFLGLGFTMLVTHPACDYDSDHPLVENAGEMLRDGCPIVKRRSFFSDPLYLDRRAVDGRALAAEVEARGYPMQMFYANLARTSVPRILATNLGLLEVLPDVDLGAPVDSPPRIAVAIHVDRPDLAAEVLDRLAHLPDGFELMVTVLDADARTALRRALSDRGLEGQVRIFRAGAGRDVAAFVVACRDILDRDDLDLVVRLHTLSGPRDEDPNRSDLLRRQLLDNLLASPAYVRNVLRLFAVHDSLGMVFPPAAHVGYPTLGHGWAGTRGRATRMADRLAITVPFDDVTPLAAYGGMFIARPVALRRLAGGDLRLSDLAATGRTGGSTTADVVERLVAYVVLSEGYHVREVAHPRQIAVGYSLLEYKYQAVSSLLPGRPEKQLAQIRRLQSKADELRDRRARDRTEARESAGKGGVGGGRARPPATRARSALRRMMGRTSGA